MQQGYQKDADRILEIIEAMGDDMTKNQADRMLERIRSASIATREIVTENILFYTSAANGLYTALREMEAEHGGYGRY